MKNKYLFVALLLLVVLILSFGLTAIYVSVASENNSYMTAGDEALDEETLDEETSDEDASGMEDRELTIVTSFYPIYIACLNITDGVDGVKLSNMSQPQTGCLHDFQMTPDDMIKLSKSDVFVVNGGGIENFMEEVAEQYPDLDIVTATDNVSLLEDGEEANAHAWMSVKLYRQMVNNIAVGLSEIDSKNSRSYMANAKEYDDKLTLLENSIEEISSQIDSQNIVIFHEAYDYVAQDYGLDVSYCLDLDEERAVSAGELRDLLSAVERDQVSYVFAEELYGRKMGETLSSQSAVKIIYLDPLNKGEYEKDSYIEGMKSNIELIKNAISGEEN